MDSIKSTDSAVADIANLATLALEPEDVERGALLFVARNNNQTHEVLDLEKYDDNPRSKRGSNQFFDAKSLAVYVNRHSDASTLLYKDDLSRGVYRVTAVFNDHADDTAAGGWADFQAYFAAIETKTWRKWKDSTSTWLSQEEFAELIEDRIDDIVEPTGATMLELAQTFQAKTKVSFESGVRLQDGQTQISYIEDITATGGSKSKLNIPATFTLGVSPFEGSDRFPVTARFRYRIREGKLALSYVLNKVEDIERLAFKDAVDAIEDETGLTALSGAAPEPRR